MQWVSSSLKDTKNKNLCVSDNGSVAEGLARQGYRNLLKCTRGLTEPPPRPAVSELWRLTPDRMLLFYQNVPQAVSDNGNRVVTPLS